MKRACRVFALFGFAVLLMASGLVRAEAPGQAEPIQILFFHDTACGSCDGTEEFLAVFSEKLADVKDLYPYTLNMHNIFQTAGSAVYRQTLDAYGLSKDVLAMPALFVDGKVWTGMSNIERNLRDQFLTAGETRSLPPEVRALVEAPAQEGLFTGFSAEPGDSTFLYFYRITCPECNETKPVIDGLPESVTVSGAQSRVVCYALNTRAGANIDRVRALFEQYGVPEAAQQVPIVFLADSYLSGYEAISAHLLEYLEEGRAQSFTFPPDP